MPVYGNDNAVRGQFAFETDETVEGLHLGNRLVDRLGAPQNPTYTIKVTVSLSERAATITAEGDSARFNVIGIATWSVVNNASGQQITSGRTEAFTSYAATSSTVATQATRDDARKRLSVILADMIVTRVIAASEDLA